MRKIFFLLSAFAFASCKALLPHPDVSDVQRAGLHGSNYSLEQLRHSRQLYVGKCGGCHTLYLPTYYAGEKWIPVIDEMAERSKLSPSEKQMILDFLVVMSEKKKKAND